MVNLVVQSSWSLFSSLYEKWHHSNIGCQVMINVQFVVTLVSNGTTPRYFYTVPYLVIICCNIVWNVQMWFNYTYTKSLCLSKLIFHMKCYILFTCTQTLIMSAHVRLITHAIGGWVPGNHRRNCIILTFT